MYDLIDGLIDGLQLTKHNGSWVLIVWRNDRALHPQELARLVAFLQIPQRARPEISKQRTKTARYRVSYIWNGRPSHA